MLRRKPSLTYNGLTVILSNPSRFDKTSLLTATGGRLFNDCLRPEYNIGQCDIRLQEDLTPLLPTTKCILLLGQLAYKKYLKQYLNNSLGEIRGLVSYSQDQIPILASFFPQDAADIRNYEAENNEQYAVDEYEGDEKDYGADKKRHGRTARSNYKFWLEKDVEKCKYLLTHNGRIPEPPFKPEYVIYPSSETVISVLQKTKGEFFFFDMETDYELNMLCFSFSFSGSNSVYIIPCLLSDYSWACSNLLNILRALAISIRDNTIVAHNGAAFDFFVLSHKYKIPIRKAYDTLLAQHRCFPEVEKSLGHTISLWAWYEPFHKDEGGGYNSPEQCRDMWAYCGKDVYTMRLCFNAINTYADAHPGLSESIEQANASIRPYLTTTLQGIKYDETIRNGVVKENDRLMMHYLRAIRMLIGEEASKTLAAKSKKGMPSSNDQCVKYFHEMLGYSVVSRGKERKDGTRAPSLAKKNMFKLKLKYENPVIDFCIAYREAQHETGMLKFTPWKE